MPDFQVFISYARKDNESPPDAPDLKGFATYFHDQLEHELEDIGGPTVKLWRDTDYIARVEQFDPIIEAQIKKSAILLVILSPNWLSRPNCQAELDKFSNRWGHEGELKLKNRIFVVSKRPVELEKRPPLLSGSVGIPFYSNEKPDASGLEHSFFWRGQARDNRYGENIRELAGYLSQAAAKLVHRDEPPFTLTTINIGECSRESDTAPTLPRRPGTCAARPTGRIIYVAQPGSDMEVAHDRVVHELVERGYEVVPDGKIPADSTAVEFIDRAIERADLSVHLLGEKAGFAPENVAPIVKLQLERAALKIEGQTSSHAERGPPNADRPASGQSFYRIIWAPKILGTEDSALSASVPREPHMVLGRFTTQLSTDKLDGEIPSKFIDFLCEAVSAHDRPQVDSEGGSGRPAQDKARVYLYHTRDDEDFVYEVAEALRTRDVDPVLPVFDELDKQAERLWHRRRLADCDAVALCWGAAKETWLRSHSNELRNWRGLGRKAPFAYRGVVTAPPPNKRKQITRLLFLPAEIDRHIDLTDKSRELAELVAQLVPGVAVVTP